MHLTEGAVSKAVLGALILYLAAHGVSGRQGLLSYVALQERARALDAESARLDAEIAALTARAARLRTDSPDFDPDYLEEKARELLGAARADEVVIDLAAFEIAGQP